MPKVMLDLSEAALEYLQKRVHAGEFEDIGHAAEEAIDWMEDVDESPEAKLAVLSAVAKQGFDAIERGEYVEFNTEEELDAYFNRLREPHVREQAEDEQLSA